MFERGKAHFQHGIVVANIEEIEHVGKILVFATLENDSAATVGIVIEIVDIILYGVVFGDADVVVVRYLLEISYENYPTNIGTFGEEKQLREKLRFGQVFHFGIDNYRHTLLKLMLPRQKIERLRYRVNIIYSGKTRNDADVEVGVAHFYLTIGDGERLKYLGVNVALI